jgi:hypothetical protein
VGSENPAGRRQFERASEARHGEDDAAFNHIWRGSWLSDETYWQELSQMREGIEAKHYGVESSYYSQFAAEE